MVHGLCHEIFLDQGSNPCLLHWQVVSSPLNHQGSPVKWFLIVLKIFNEKEIVLQYIVPRHDMYIWNKEICWIPHTMHSAQCPPVDSVSQPCGPEYPYRSWIQRPALGAWILNHLTGCMSSLLLCISLLASGPPCLLYCTCFHPLSYHSGVSNCTAALTEPLMKRFACMIKYTCCFIDENYTVNNRLVLILQKNC